jgi:hypothetical protein
MHRARAARARAKYTFYRFYTAPCGAPHTIRHSGGPRNFDKLVNVISGPCGPFPCVCMLLQNSQSAKSARSVFGILTTFLGVFNSYQELRSMYVWTPPRVHEEVNSTCRHEGFVGTIFSHNRPKNDAQDLKKKWSRKTRPAFLYNL